MLTRSQKTKWLTLFAFIASLFPIPVAPAKNLDDPFPCMFSRCGCMTADQCWQGCCCRTDAEKLAWAEEHGVRPPDWFLDKMKSSEAGQLCEDVCGSPSGSCCGKKVPAKKASCCDGKRTEPVSLAMPKAKSRGKRWIVLDDALRCKGSSAAIGYGIAKMASSPQVFAIMERCVWLETVAFDFSLGSGLQPPIPPPRSLGNFS